MSRNVTVFFVVTIFVMFAIIMTPNNIDTSDSSGFAVHPVYGVGYALPYAYSSSNVNTFLQFSSVDASVSRSFDVTDTVVYNRGYVSYDGQQWQPFSLTTTNAVSGSWIYTKATASVSFTPAQLRMSLSRNVSNNTFVVIYSCYRNVVSSSWDCHDGWQIIKFDARIITTSTPAPICTANLKECLNSTVSRQCNVAGSAWVNTNCLSGQTCTGGTCLATIATATCNDRIQNQGETGIDCGGPCTACSTNSGPSTNCGSSIPCPVGLTCNSNNLCVSASGTTYYVSTTGSDGNSGTSLSNSFATWQKGFTKVVAGDILYIKGGTYNPTGSNYGVTINGKSGTSTKPIYVWAYPGETPILNGSGLSTSGSREGINFGNTNYWHLKGLSVATVKQTSGGGGIGFGLYAANSNIIENCKAYGNGGVGFYVREGSTNNLFKNCDAYANYDPNTGGDDADGFDLGFLSSGTVNTLDGCRSWDNSDDGYDLYTNEGNVIFKNCWAWSNGYGTIGQGCGFKLGPTTDKPTQTLRTITNCIAYNNHQRGFGQEDADVKMIFYNNIAYKNTDPGFYFYEHNVADILRNNIAYNNGGDNLLKSNQITSNNSWQNGLVVDANDFVSLDGSQLVRLRKDDGSLPDITFLHLKQGSDLIDKGVNVGLPYSGNYPDLGAFEYP